MVHGQIVKLLNAKRPRHVSTEIQSEPAFGTFTQMSNIIHYTGKWDNHPPSLDNWILHGNADIKKTIKTCTDSLPLNKPTHYYNNE